MNKETTLIGLLGIFIGIFAYLKTANLKIAVIFIILGILMITLGKNENRIEERKDG